MTGHIDTHQHMLPDFYDKWLRDHGIEAAGGRALPSWSADEALEVMDGQGISTGILSISAPGVHLGNPANARAMAREVNQFAAQLVKDRPERFGFFASLPLPDLDAAIDEAAVALDDLHADGVVILANQHGTYLGDPTLDPLMDALDQRSAVVFVHPANLPSRAAEGIPPFAADFLLDTTRAAYNLVRYDVPGRYPRIRFILAHAGGFVPYAAHRLAVALVADLSRDPGQILDDFAGFYYDTALSASPAAFPSLRAFAKPGHILYGSDWPFAPELAVTYFNNPDLIDDDISHHNARSLFPRLMPG